MVNDDDMTVVRQWMMLQSAIAKVKFEIGYVEGMIERRENYKSVEKALNDAAMAMDDAVMVIHTLVK